MTKPDIVIIGSGMGGATLAAALASLAVSKASRKSENAKRWVIISSGSIEGRPVWL